MSGQKLQVTLSATDQMTPTFKQVAATVMQLNEQFQLLGAGFAGVEGKVRSVGTTMKDALGGVVSAPLKEFSATLNQTGINFTDVGAKAQGAQSKFAAFGSAVMANGTAFGVAGASAFGLFNAIDNLEKVQLRASTATLRSTTATTALQTAELALANAKATGTASTEQIALLEQRVADARERVSVTTERATIFQQDYTEALAGLALQIGPQVIALAGSMAQVYTTLNATFAKGGGFVNTLRTAYQTLTGTQVSSNAAAAASIPIFRGMATAENTATVATRGLSTAVKGLLAATGVGIAVVIGTSLFEAFSASADEAKTSVEGLTPAVDSAGQSMDEFGNVAATAVKDLPAGFAELKTTLDDISKATEEQSKKIGQNIALIVNGAVVTTTEAAAKAANTGKQSIEEVMAFQQKAIDTLEARRTFLQKAIKSQAASGVTSPELQTELDAIPGKIDTITTSMDKNAATVKTLTPLTNQYTAEVLGMGEGMSVADANAQVWLQTQVDSRIQTIQDLVSLRELAQAHGVEIPESVELSVSAYEKYIATKLGLVSSTDQATSSEQMYAEGVKKAREASVTSTEELGKMEEAHKLAGDQARIMTETLAGEGQVIATTMNQQIAFNDIIVGGIQGLNEQAIALHLKADANAVATQQTIVSIQAAGEEVIALTNLGEIYDGSATSFLALTKAKVAGVTSAQAFITASELEATTLAANTAALQEFITVNEGIEIPPWITVTPELLKKMQQEIAATGGAFGTLAAAMNEAMAPALASIDKLVNAESLKELKKAFKDLPGIDDFSKNTRNALIDIENDMRVAQTRFKEFGTDWNQLVIGITRGASGKVLADLGKQLKTDFESFSKIDVTGMTKVFDPVIEFLDNLSGTKLRTEGPKLFGIVNDIMKAFESGQTIDWDEMNSLIIENADAFALFPDVFAKIVAEGHPSAEAIQAVQDAMANPANIDAFRVSLDGVGASLELLKTRAPTPGDLASIERLKSQFMGGTPGPDESFKKDEKKDGEDGAEVPGPVKADDFDTKKAAIIKEITDIGLTKVVPTVVPAPDATAFTNAMNTLLLIPADFSTRFNAAFVGLIVPAPNQEAFTNAMNTLLLIPADFTARFNAAFAALTIPAPVTDTFVSGLAPVSEAVVATIADMSVLSVALVIPAPETDAFTGGFESMAAAVIKSLTEISTFVAGDLTTSFTDLPDKAVQPFVDSAEKAETTVDKALQKIVDFLEKDLTTAFEDMQSAAESAAEGAANAMDDVISAMESAEESVQSLISAIKAIPTRVDITVFVGLEGPGIAFLAGGYHGIVDTPTLLVVGEAGAERVDVSPATGPTGGNNLFIEGNDSRTGITNPLLQKDTGPIGMPLPYTQPPVVMGPQGPMVANITIPVYVNGQYQGTTQTTKILRDMGAYLS